MRVVLQQTPSHSPCHRNLPRPALGSAGHGWLVLGLAIAALLVISTVAPVVAQAGQREHGWESIRPKVERLLSKHLSRSEMRRLLRKRHVRRALVATLRDYDGGKLDRLSVRREGRTVKITFLDRQSERICIDLGKTPETGEEPQCTERVETKDRRSIVLTRDLWRKPKPKPKAKTTPPAPTPKAEAPKSILFGGYARKIAKERMSMLGISGDVVALVGGYWGFREGVRDSSTWHDPFEATFKSGDKLAPVKPFNPPKAKPARSIEGNAMENLRYIYDVSRMRTAWPVPDPFGLYARQPPGSAGKPLAVAKPSKACLKSFKTSTPDTPPTLQCFQTALRFRNLDKDEAYQVARGIGMFVSIPFLKDIMQQRVATKSYESQSTYLWAHAWMQWAKKFGSRVPTALTRLTAVERMQLRWRLSKWWFNQKYQSFAPTIANIYERHFDQLYPNARDRHGWPRRSRFKNDYLWALNWMAQSERKPSQVAAAHGRLPAKEKAIVASLAADAAHIRRFPSATAAVAAAFGAKP